MKNSEQLSESIQRYDQVFWGKRSTGRPPVSIMGDDVYMPIQYLNKKLTQPVISPQDMEHDLSVTDYDFVSSHKAIANDDFIPFSSPWRAIPWLEAICGCPVRYATGSLAPGHFVRSLNELAEIELPANAQWLEVMKDHLQYLAAALPSDCWISPTILRGPSDVISAMRGLTEFYCDLTDDVSIIDSTAEKVNQLLIDTLDLHFSIVKPKSGGYGHIFGYWASEKTVVIQEDAMGMCNPDTYGEIFMRYNQQLVSHFGGSILFHLHSTGYRHYRKVLEIDGLAGIELTVELKGPGLIDMVDDLRYILEKSRLILFVDHCFEQLPEALNKLPKEGLYLIISDKYISSEKQFTEFVNSIW